MIVIMRLDVNESDVLRAPPNHVFLTSQLCTKRDESNGFRDRAAQLPAENEQDDAQ